MSKPARTVSHEERPPIQPRLFTLPIADDTPRYWMNDDPYATQLLNAFSCIFPGGERFFMKSVLRYQSQITDARLKREVRQFCGQEAVHGQQHEAYNKWAERFGYPLEAMTKRFEERLMRRTRRQPEMIQLALTAALEHFTAVMGNALLTSPKLLERMNPEIRPLWIWHAIEEIEHKAVAYDVMIMVGGRYHHRVIGMFLAIFGLTTSTAVLMAKLLWRDRQLFNFGSAYTCFELMRSSGFLGSVARGIKEYFRRDFHPWQTDDRSLLESFLPLVTSYVPEQRSTMPREVPA
jgi:predicted metal-dependent hydrolase